MVFGFFIALIFIIVEIGISSYLVYDLHCKKDEDIKKLERRVKAQEKNLAAQAGKLPCDTDATE